MTVSTPSYATMPKCGQIMLLALCRAIEPIAYSAVSPYLYFMIRSFGFDSPSTISSLTTFTLASFALGQSISGLLWGRISDRIGRKPVLIVGLCGVLICTVAFGCSTSIYMAIATRFTAGFLNGNVALIRTIVGEIVANHKDHQSHAFTVLPIAMNLGTILGPISTGMLANPVENLPGLFGNSKLFKKFPYLLPNLVATPLLLFAIIAITLFVEETGQSKSILLPSHKDPGLKVGNKIKRWWNGGYEQVDTLSNGSNGASYDTFLSPDDSDTQVQSQAGSVRQALTKRVVVTLTCYTLLSSHCSFYLQLLPIFLATPRMDSTHTNPIEFNGGVGLTSFQIGLMLSIVSVVAVIFQLVAYPSAAKRFGSIGIHRIGLFAYLTYIIIPYLSFLPKENFALIITCTAILATGPGLGTSFAMPPLEVLLTEASPPFQLGTVNGLAQTGTSLARTFGPITFGNLFALGIKLNVIGLAWWVISAVVLMEMILATRLR